MTEDYIAIDEPRSPAEMESLSRDDLARLSAQRQEIVSRPSLVEALLYMGRFDEALMISKDTQQVVWINKIKKAELREDTHRCGCKSTIDCTDYVLLERLPEDQRNAARATRESPNYIRSFRYWSPRRSTYLTFYQCQECGCVQSLPDDTPIDELHTKHYDLQKAALTTELRKTSIRRL